MERRHIRPGMDEIILAYALGELTLAAALERGFMLGYSAKVTEEAHVLRRNEPIETVQSTARRVLRQHPLPSMRARADRAWTWHADLAGWSVEDDDCTIRPSRSGSAVIVMEAAGEWSGEVLIDENAKSPFLFPDGSFR
jgi:hypothetical protein